MVHENFGTIEFFEKTPTGVRMIFSKNGDRDSAAGGRGGGLGGGYCRAESLRRASRPIIGGSADIVLYWRLPVHAEKRTSRQT